jgi:hypothetical protein
MTAVVETSIIEVACERIMSAFGNDDREVILNANDLFKAAGTSREEYLKALEILVDRTHELTELQQSVDYESEDDPESCLYLRPKSRRES